MSEPHTRYEELAVGHVLGGLPQDDATEFRGHLINCRDCRLRVAELRDIAADLEAAEKQERQLARTKTEVARRDEPNEQAPPADRSWPWRLPSPRTVGVLVVGTVVLLVALAVWSFHLRTVNAQLLGVAQRQEVVMETFADGITVATRFGGTTTGRVAISQDRVAMTLVGIPQPRADRRLVIWLVTGDEAEPRYVGTGASLDGRIAWAGPLGDADRLLVTLERWPPEDASTTPSGTVLAEADLTVPQVESVPEGTEPRSPFVAR